MIKAQEWKAVLTSTYGFSVVSFYDLNVSEPVFISLASASQSLRLQGNFSHFYLLLVELGY